VVEFTQFLVGLVSCSCFAKVGVEGSNPFARSSQTTDLGEASGLIRSGVPSQ